MSTKESPRKTARARTEEDQGSGGAGSSHTRPLKWKTVESRQLNLRLANLYPPNSKGCARLCFSLPLQLSKSKNVLLRVPPTVPRARRGG